MTTHPTAPPIPDALDQILCRMRLPYLRKAAPDVLATAREARAIKKGVLFVSATRTGGEGTYDSGTPGVIGAADLSPQKARVLLQLGLAFSSKEDQIRTWFTTIGDPEFDLSAFRR
ncbi:hypothetical protein [Streptomyces mirabilis]|uniref:hypothetical protein n=1 Tax=Streptomyces mirabilis TaxID=68239 RepID=UPI00332CC6A1